jgi:Rad3-related DNA helicase
MEDISEVVGKGGVLIAEACNGFGKTVCALSSVLELGKGIVYATRTHEQARQVLHEVEVINTKSGRSFSAVSLAGRRHLCMNRVCRSLPPVESSEACRLMRETGKCTYRSEVASLPRTLPKVLSIQELQNQGRALKLCPYFLARKVAEVSTVTVAPYQYVFNESIRSKAKLTLSDKVLIFDEAHNADKIGLDALSDAISERGLSNAWKELELVEASPDLIDRLRGHLEENVSEEAVVRTGLELRAELEKLLDVEGLLSFADSLSGLADEVRMRKLEEGKMPASYLGGVASFLSLVASSPGERYIAVYRRSAQGVNLLEYRCLDPSLAIEPVVKEASGAIIMSGTLSPLALFAEVIGLPEAQTRAYSSIARRENVRLIIDTTVTTKFSDRSDEMAISYGRRIAKISERIPNGILVFFTQRALMLRTLALWRETGILGGSGRRLFLGKRRVFVEGENAEKNRSVVEEYKRAAREDGAVLFATFRGRNAEGSNFPDEEARGVFLVGVPYADFHDPVVRAQIDYFNRRRAGLGRRWYTMDAFRAANQAIGRGIRHREDWCTFIFMDRRYQSQINLIAEWARANGVEVIQ